MSGKESLDIQETNIVIKAEDLHFTYEMGHNSKAKKVTGADVNETIKGINLSLYRGETVALVGGNGAGKTTLGKLLTGILKAQRGKVTIYGKNTEELGLSAIGRIIGYAFQNPRLQLFTGSVEEEIAFGLHYSGYEKESIKKITDELIDLMELESVRHSFPLNLSYGEKKRVALAAILALSPKYIILDEPTTGLDRDRIEILNNTLKMLRDKGVGMLLISHNRNFLDQNANRLLTMNEGRILDDKRF